MQPDPPSQSAPPDDSLDVALERGGHVERAAAAVRKRLPVKDWGLRQHDYAANPIFHYIVGRMISGQPRAKPLREELFATLVLETPLRSREIMEGIAAARLVRRRDLPRSSRRTWKAWFEKAAENVGFALFAFFVLLCVSGAGAALLENRREFAKAGVFFGFGLSLGGWFLALRWLLSALRATAYGQDLESARMGLTACLSTGAYIGAETERTMAGCGCGCSGCVGVLFALLAASMAVAGLDNINVSPIPAASWGMLTFAVIITVFLSGYGNAKITAERGRIEKFIVQWRAEQGKRLSE